MRNSNKLKKAFKAAFPHTIPILAGFLFLGAAYGLYMNTSGFNPIYPMLMSLLIFAGSVEFVTVGFLLAPFDPLGAFIMTLMVNARHLFYGISMLDKYRKLGLKKIYLIFGLCDESFSINYTANIPKGVDKGWFMFFVTLLNHLYWVAGATIGGFFGSFITFNTNGIEFVMTALFIVIFLEQWLKEEKHFSSITGLFISIICLILFKRDNFIIPSMICILLVLTLARKHIDKPIENEEITEEEEKYQCR
ncbi:MAG TPA: azaleucine resistance protein AzlC [Clostridium sp.]|nr:azaleucine resistance protein AzlC [Clostridium sp.]